MTKKVLEIGLSCSPSHFVDKGTLKKFQRILVSYGGGIGGANKTYYTESIYKEQAINGMWTFVDFDGQKIQLNPRFIVEICETDVLILKTDITEHKNYHKKTCDKHILTEWIDLGFLGFNDYKLLEKARNSSGKIHIFKSESETK